MESLIVLMLLIGIPTIIYYRFQKSYFQIWCMNVVKRLTDYYRVTRYHL